MILTGDRAINTVLGVVAAAVLAFVVAAGWGAYAWGKSVGTARCEEQRAKDQTAAIAEAHERYTEGVRIGARSAEALGLQLQAAQSANNSLSKELADVPKFVRLAGPGCGGGEPGVAGQRPQPDPQEAGAAGELVRFTLAAQRVWNSALAGADVPAGACRSDAQAAGACAADSGVTVERAFANAVENGARFRACLSQLNAFIDFEGARQAAAYKGHQGQP